MLLDARPTPARCTLPTRSTAFAVACCISPTLRSFEADLAAPGHAGRWSSRAPETAEVHFVHIAPA